jgi:hypothetical protein
VNGRTWTKRPGTEHVAAADASGGGGTAAAAASAAGPVPGPEGAHNRGGVCLHLAVHSGLERDAVDEIKAVARERGILGSVVRKVSAPRAGLVVVVASLPSVPAPHAHDAAEAAGRATAEEAGGGRRQRKRGGSSGRERRR